MTKDMTHGSPVKLILGFALPLLAGMLFQQLYNLVDAMIVGRFLGVTALAGVGATGSINFLVLGVCMGGCAGFSIPVAQRFGAREESRMREFVANGVILSAAFAAVITTLTVCFCRDILTMMNTPQDCFEEAYLYIVVIFAGIPFMILYNLLSGYLRSLGDSRTPVYFLVMSSVINIGLDLLFICVFSLGVAGAAWATVIAQTIAGISCLLFMIRKYEILHLQKAEWKADSNLMLTLCSMGVPMGLQYSITAIGSVILQSATNTLGSMAVAAVTAGNRVSSFLATPFDALGSTMATYGGQNVGAGKLDRIGTGLKSAIVLGAGYSAIAFVLCFLGGAKLAQLFLNPEEMEVIGNVHFYLICFTAFYFPLALVNIIRFMIQGMGYPTFAILAGVFEMIARAAAGIFLVPRVGFLGSCLGSPLAWILADCFLIPAYFHVKKKTAVKLQKQGEILL